MHHSWLHPKASPLQRSSGKRDGKKTKGDNNFVSYIAMPSSISERIGYNGQFVPRTHWKFHLVPWKFNVLCAGLFGTAHAERYNLTEAKPSTVLCTGKLYTFSNRTIEAIILDPT